MSLLGLSNFVQVVPQLSSTWKTLESLIISYLKCQTLVKSCINWLENFGKFDQLISQLGKDGSTIKVWKRRLIVQDGECHNLVCQSLVKSYLNYQLIGKLWKVWSTQLGKVGYLDQVGERHDIM